MEKKDWKTIGKEIQSILLKTKNAGMYRDFADYKFLVDELEGFIEFFDDNYTDEDGKREYFSMGMEYFSLIEDSNIYQEKGWKLPKEKAERLQILEKIFKLLSNK